MISGSFGLERRCSFDYRENVTARKFATLVLPIYVIRFEPESRTWDHSDFAIQIQKVHRWIKLYRIPYMTHNTLLFGSKRVVNAFLGDLSTQI